MKHKNTNFENVIKDYQSGISLKDLSIKYNISFSSIYYIVNKNNISLKGRKRKYHFNEKYFDKIDNPDKAYFLGWLYSDGNNFTKTGEIKIKIQERDSGILETLGKRIFEDSEFKITEVLRTDGQDQRILSFSSVYTSKVLVDKGVLNKKSLILKFPTEEQVPKNLLSHFIRGYFDGDGCITTYMIKSGSKFKLTGVFSIVGTESFCLDCRNFISNEISLKKTKIISQANVFKLSWGGNKQIKKIYDWLYKDCEDLYLKRKKEKFEQLFINR